MNALSGGVRAGRDRVPNAVAAAAPTCEVHRWGRSRITRGITALLLLAVVSLGLYLVERWVVGTIAGTGPGAPGASAASSSLVSNYFWLASICFGFIGTLRFSVYKEVTSCPACAQVGDPPFYRDPATAFHRYITMVIVSTLSAFLAVVVTFVAP